MIWISWLWRNPVTRAVGAVGLAVVGVLLWGKAKKREGAAEAIMEMEDADQENAAGIRERVDAVRRDPVRVRPNDERGYRD